MEKKTFNFNEEVTDFLDGQNHPLRTEIEQLRICILSANNNLTENVKWNGPNYRFNKEDRITIKIHPSKNIQLIFHRGAEKHEQPRERIIQTNSKLLQWKENDRAIVTFKNMVEISEAKTDLTEIVNKWISATK